MFIVCKQEGKFLCSLQRMIEEHEQIWQALISFLDCDGRGPVDPVANLLFSLVMLFIVDDKDAARLEHPQAVALARKRREDVLGRYLKVSHGSNVAMEKLNMLESFVGLAKEFYVIHRQRVFDD